MQTLFVLSVTFAFRVPFVFVFFAELTSNVAVVYLFFFSSEILVFRLGIVLFSIVAAVSSCQAQKP